MSATCLQCILLSKLNGCILIIVITGNIYSKYPIGMKGNKNHTRFTSWENLCCPVTTRWHNRDQECSPSNGKAITRDISIIIINTSILPPWMWEQLMKSHPQLRSYWWVLEEEESVFFRDEVPERLLTLQQMVIHLYKYKQY